MLRDSCDRGGSYRVQLEAFEGPLDLLLRLIEREELDITQVSLALVTGQYLAHLALLERARVEDLADFLVVAARLILIKSRALLPVSPGANESESADPEGDLVARLKEYRRFKQAAEALRVWENLGLRSYARLTPAPVPEMRFPPGGGNVQELVDAMFDALRQHSPEAPVDRVVAPITVTIGDRIAFITEELHRLKSITFHGLLQSCKSRAEIVVTFLALLELMRLLRVQVWQEKPFGEIVIEAVLPPKLPDEATQPSPPPETWE